MIKYVLLSIAAVLVILAIYTYSDQDNEKSIQKPTISKQIEEPKETKQISLPVVKDTKTVLKKTVITSPKAVSKEAIPGSNIRINDIENSFLTEKEKKLMIDDIAYFESIDTNFEPTLSENEILQIIEKDLLNGLN